MLIEPIAIMDVFASGTYRLEEVSEGLWRYTFFARQLCADGSCHEDIAVARIVMPAGAVRDLTLKTMFALKCPPGCAVHARQSLERH